MSISDTVKKVMPYLKTASGYVLHRLSSQAVEMDDGTTLEQKVTSLNSLISNKVDMSDVVNNCLTTEEGFVLDARQGKVLDDKITELNGNLPANNRGNTTYLYKVGYSCFLHTGGTSASSVVSTLPANYRPSRAVTVSGWCRNISNGRYYPCMGLINTNGTWSYLTALTSLNTDESTYFIYNASDGTNRLANFSVWIHGAWATNINGV